MEDCHQLDQEVLDLGDFRRREEASPPSTRFLAPRRPDSASYASHDPTADEVVEDDVGGGETHDAGYHRLREEMGAAEEHEVQPRCSGFSEARLEAVRPFGKGEANYIKTELDSSCEFRGTSWKMLATPVKP